MKFWGKVLFITGFAITELHEKINLHKHSTLKKLQRKITKIFTPFPMIPQNIHSIPYDPPKYLPHFL
jgi:hypothetical protein